MSLGPGARLGIYEILGPIGAGGMGVVYRATDSRLGRTVALKIVRSELLANEESARRFEREARLLASLNHPRIATIHGIEESGDTRFLVLEYVPGPTLAERLQRGPLPLREALLVGKQVAEGLEAAHARGIIHRDLKPANIKVTEDGQVKVLDFGLAKPILRNPATAETESISALTSEISRGVTIIGTAAYMSPEQARAKELDCRTDIWSFGCVLYEALTARQTFRGDTVTEVLAAVIEREPDWTALPANTPPAVVTLLRRCLRKDMTSRLRDVGDARIELEDTLSGRGLELAEARSAGMTRRTALGALAGAAAGVVATGLLAVKRYRGPLPRNLTQFSVAVPGGEAIRASWATHVAISPDGRRIAFSADQFYIRPLGSLAASKLEGQAGTDGDCPFFSPDGRSIGLVLFTPTLRLQRVAASGGAATTICDVGSVAGLNWADDGNIYFVSQQPGTILAVPADGGQVRQVSTIAMESGERQHRDPFVLPGAKAILFTAVDAETETFDDAHISVLSLQTGQRKVLVERGTHARYSPSGHLVYARNGNLLAVRFDPERLEVQGQPMTVLEGVLMSRNTGVANYDISESGDLVYVPGKADGGARALYWVDRNGNAERLPLPSRSYLHPRLSPDMRQLAVEIEGPNHDFYLYDFARGVLTKMTTDGVSHWPVWSPDGRQIAYRSGPMGQFKLWRVPGDRSAPPQLVPATGSGWQSAESWSPDGRAIAYTVGEAGIGIPPNIMITPVDGGHPAEPFGPSTTFVKGSPKFSPDGRWLSFCSNESGKPQVYVQAYPGPGPKVQVSGDGGADPVWKGAGGELYYRNGDSMMVVEVSTTPMFSAARPRELWKGHYTQGMSSSCGHPGPTSSNYDVTSDGERFLMIKDEDQDAATSKQVVVALAWTAEIDRLFKA